MRFLLFFVFLLPLQAQISDPNFVSDNIHFGNGKTALDFLPDGTMIAAEKQGVLLVYPPDGSGGFEDPSIFYDLSGQVDATQEAGLLGLAVDPDFSVSRRIFMFYTTASDQRVTSVIANGDSSGIELGSEAVLLSDFPRSVTFHKAGDIEFQPGDPANLYIVLGDDGGEGTMTVDGIPRVQHPDYYHGKILKVDKNSGLGLTGNPFYDGDTSAIRSRVWAVGFRNPFRFAFHPLVPDSDVLYSSENGDATDRISWVRAGSNGSWSAAGDGGGFLDPPDTNHRVMTTIDPSQIGIAIAAEGPFAIGGNPTLYAGNWYPAPYGIYRWQLTGSDLDQLTLVPGDGDPLLADSVVAVDLTFGPDGALYFCETGGGDAQGGFYGLRRLRFVGGVQPTASMGLSPSSGRGEIPFRLNFTDNSSAGGGASIVSRRWEFGDGSATSSQNPSYTYDLPGAYTVSLTVTDSNGLSDTVTETVTAVRTVNLDFDGQVFDGRTVPAINLNSPTELALYQLDGITPLAFDGGTGGNGNRIALAAGGSINSAPTLELLGDGFVISAGEAGGDGVQAGRIGISIPPGQGTAAATLEFFLSSTMIAGRITDARQRPLALDVGVAPGGLSNYIDLAGGRDHQASPTGFDHRRDSDNLGYYHIAIPTGQSSADVYFDLPGDTNTHIYTPGVRVEFVEEGSENVIDFVVGQFDGGEDCNDLSSIGTTPAVNYETQIQTIWSASCTGCHNATASNSAGLDLTGESLTNLVDAMSTQVTGLKLVTPGEPTASFLFEKINCNEPQIGTRMRPTENMVPAQQALIRDWILQLAPHVCPGIGVVTEEWPTNTILDVILWVNSNCGD